MIEYKDMIIENYHLEGNKGEYKWENIVFKNVIFLISTEDRGGLCPQHNIKFTNCSFDGCKFVDYLVGSPFNPAYWIEFERCALIAVDFVYV